MEEENLIVIREYDSVNEAEWDKSLLEGAGIYATIRNEIMAAVYPIGFAPAQLVIRKRGSRQGRRDSRRLRERVGHPFHTLHAASACAYSMSKPEMVCAPRRAPRSRKRVSGGLYTKSNI